jgi:hypothetical protein
MESVYVLNYYFSKLEKRCGFDELEEKTQAFLFSAMKLIASKNADKSKSFPPHLNFSLTVRSAICYIFAIIAQDINLRRLGNKYQAFFVWIIVKFFYF